VTTRNWGVILIRYGRPSIIVLARLGSRAFALALALAWALALAQDDELDPMDSVVSDVSDPERVLLLMPPGPGPALDVSLSRVGGDISISPGC
jgi:hypothetical protein